MKHPEPQRAWRPSATDVAVAMAAAAYGVGDSLVLPRSGLLTGHPEPAAVVSGLLGVLVLWRRRWPLAVTAGVLVGHVVSYAPAALIAALYTVGGNYRSRPRILVTVFVVALGSQMWSAQAGGRGLDVFHGLAFVAGPLLVGLYAATQQQLTASVKERAAALESEQALMAEQARAEERARIAGELHDVVAHRVSHMVLAAGILSAGADRGGDRVRTEAERIRRTGVQALEELREILDVLTARQAMGDVPLEPVPTAADLGAMVEDCRHLGMDIALTVSGALDDLPAAVQATVCRVVKECLTNAFKHAPGSAVAVDVRRGTDTVCIEVANGPATTAPRPDLPSGGHGLVGLAERLRVLGGTFRAAGRPDGGFVVRAEVPVHRERSAPSPSAPEEP
ncbi:sensor histidine kinase [Streptomyces sp. NPDC001262]|uniref:sensor histidine kinase n=1 Tax=unclassified Streptomyces TaxID=2593676 RepID=UPI00367C046A